MTMTSPAYQFAPTVLAAWAKSDAVTGDSMPLVRHLADTAEVARLYWLSYLPQASRHVVERCLANAGAKAAGHLAHRLAIFLACAHDLGKMSAAFAMQVPALADRMRRAGFRFPSLSSNERRGTPHSVVSQAHLSDWLVRRFGFSGVEHEDTLAVVLGGHHGVFPTETALQGPSTPNAATGNSEIWIQSRDALLVAAQHRAGLSDDELEWLASKGIDQASQLVLSGFVIVCDWIASNADLFPYLDSTDSAARAREALRLLELPPPWQPAPPEEDEELFRSRFGLPMEASPRPVQRSAMTIARQMGRPELIIIEAPTGEGKTEAAYAATEILAAKFGCGGVMTALPTQATSDAMFLRKQRWLERTLPRDTEVSISLSHGKAQFNDNYVDLARDRREDRFDDIAQVYDDPSSGQVAAIRAHWWLAGRKKSALADFVVGTIDQVLLSALISRHVMLRHLGFSGKVVILDEIHAADHYMSVYLDRSLEWLAAMGVPVIALSATLPPQRRVEMLAAYQRGRGDTAEQIQAVSDRARASTGYPLTSTSDQNLAPAVSKPSGRRSSTRVRFVDGYLAGYVLDQVSDGGCLAVIHNTVGRAQDTYRQLKPVLGDEVVLLHSRFITTDRMAIERGLGEQLGPNASGRPHRLVVVATQVIEQSLDLDFDAMVSDLAPLDAIIQRLGRLHRHERPADSRPNKLQEPVLAITGVTRERDAAPTLDAGSAKVYGAALLLRSLAVLTDHLSVHTHVTSPDDVPGLVREAYEPDLTCPTGWESAWDSAELAHARGLADQRAKATGGCVAAPRRGSRALIGWSDTASDFKDEERAIRAVRDTANSIEAVIVMRCADGVVRSLPWLPEHAAQRVDLGVEIEPGLAKSIARCTLRLPAWLSEGSLGDAVVRELERDGFDTWQRSRWLKGVLPFVVNDDLTREVAGLVLRYDRNEGLLVRKGVDS